MGSRNEGQSHTGGAAAALASASTAMSEARKARFQLPGEPMANSAGATSKELGPLPTTLPAPQAQKTAPGHAVQSGSKPSQSGGGKPSTTVKVVGSAIRSIKRSESMSNANASPRDSRILFGESLEHDARIAKISERERFLLSVIIPRIRSTRDAWREWSGRSTKRSVWVPCFCVLVLQVGLIALCANPSCDFICAFGPDPEDDAERTWYSHAFSDYGPPMISVLASLMLSFYANVCMGLYKDGYFAAQNLKSSVVDMMTMVVGTIPAEYPVIREEFWRCINLYHLCSYVLADKSRATYNVNNFLLPVATAYGEHDGETCFGMLRFEELQLLTKGLKMPSHLESSFSSASSLSGAGTASGMRLADPAHSIFNKALSLIHTSRISEDQELTDLKEHKRKRLSERSGSWNWKKGINLTRRRRTLTSARRFVNSRGDVSSVAAVLHAALGIRMYMLVDLVIAEKLSRVAWPAWNSVCLKLRTTSETMKQRSLFRLPRIYQASVRFLVASTILTDTIVLSSHASRLIRHGGGHAEWSTHAYIGATFDVFLNILLTWCLAVFIDAVSDMQTPFGAEGLDMPGLSYVCAAAELSLRMVHNDESNKFGLFSLLNSPLDKERMMRGSSFKKEKSRTKKSQQDDEEEDDAGE